MLLSEPQTLAVIHATRPLRAREQAQFLADLVTLLTGRERVGDGELGRMLARLQRDHFQSRPSDAEVGTVEMLHRRHTRVLGLRMATPR